MNQLEVHGRTARLHRNADQAAAVERGDGLIPWNGDAQSMIDRFDGRALLDMYREPPAHALNGRIKTADELKLEEVNRQLVRGVFYLCLGVCWVLYVACFTMVANHSD